MEMQAGDRVLVNVAPFIGAARRNKDSVPCRVIEVDAGRVRVRTEPPYRTVELWIHERWIDGRLEEAELLDEPSLA